MKIGGSKQLTAKFAGLGASNSHKAKDRGDKYIPD